LAMAWPSPLQEEGPGTGNKLSAGPGCECQPWLWTATHFCLACYWAHC